MIIKDFSIELDIHIMMINQKSALVVSDSYSSLIMMEMFDIR